MLGPVIPAPSRVKAEIEDYYFTEQDKHVLQAPWGQNIDNNLIKLTAMSTCVLQARPDPGIRYRETVIRRRYMVSSDGEGSPESFDGNESVEELPAEDNDFASLQRPACLKSGRALAPSSSGRVRKSSRRGKGSPKEKDRAREFNCAFDTLRKRIPSIPASKKLSKIEILRLAISYIVYLRFLLGTDAPNLRHNSKTLQSDVPELVDTRNSEESDNVPGQEEKENEEKEY